MGGADLKERASTIITATVGKIMQVTTIHEVSDYGGNPGVGFIIPSINLPLRTVGDYLSCIILGLENGNSSNNSPIYVHTGALSTPGISGELASEFPLPAPRGAQLRGCLFIDDVVAASVPVDGVHLSDIEDGVASDWMSDVKGFGEGKFNSPLTRRHEDGGVFCIHPKGVVVAVKFKGSAHPFEGLGRVRGALKITIDFDEGADAFGDGILRRSSTFVEGLPGDFNRLGEGFSGDQVNGQAFGLPMLNVGSEELLGTGLVAGQH